MHSGSFSVRLAATPAGLSLNLGSPQDVGIKAFNVPHDMLAAIRVLENIVNNLPAHCCWLLKIPKRMRHNDGLTRSIRTQACLPHIAVYHKTGRLKCTRQQCVRGTQAALAQAMQLRSTVVCIVQAGHLAIWATQAWHFCKSSFCTELTKLATQGCCITDTISQC